MTLIWKDINDDKGAWSHLSIEVKNKVENGFQIQSGGKLRFKLVKENLTLFWGCIEHDYYGAWMLRNKVDWEEQNRIIPPITSAQIEDYKTTNPTNKTAYWSRFFAKALEKSENTILYTGKWKISQALLKWKSQKSDAFMKWVINESEKAFSNSQLTYLDWGISGSDNLLPLKDSPANDDGRVKWWRKKVKENTCPPILTWYVDSLTAFIIIDGHSRLKAFMLEEKTPEILVLNSYKEEYYPTDISRRDNIIKCLKIREEDPLKQNLSIGQINELLIDAYDNRPFIRNITKSKARHDFESTWVAEVSAFRKHPKIDQDELAYMIKNMYD